MNPHYILKHLDPLAKQILTILDSQTSQVFDPNHRLKVNIHQDLFHQLKLHPVHYPHKGINLTLDTRPYDLAPNPTLRHQAIKRELEATLYLSTLQAPTPL